MHSYSPRFTALVLGVSLLILLMSVPPSQATLIDRGLFNDGFGFMMNLIYDEGLDITWLGNANFATTSGFARNRLLTFDEANAFVGSLTVGGFTDWRLPTTTQPDPSCSIQVNGKGFGFGCTGSELGHLYNVEGITSESGGPFSQVRSRFYWSGTEFSLDSDSAWGHRFDIRDPRQHPLPKTTQLVIWAVRDGDVGPSPIPEPSTMLLLGTGLAGLTAWRYRKSMIPFGGNQS